LGSTAQGEERRTRLVRTGALGFVFLLVASLAQAADDATVVASVDAQRVGLDDEVQLTVTLQGRSIDLAEEIALPPLKHLRLASGPFVSTQLSVVNGAISQGKTYTFMLRPTAVGKAEIGAVRARLQQGERTTASISIEVVPGSAKPRERRSVDPFGGDPFLGDPFEELLGGRRRSARRAAPKLQAEAVASRKTLYVGEPLLLTLYVYTQASIANLDFAKTPQFAGFWSEELPRSEQQQGELAVLEGEQYRRFAIIRKVLFPTKPGRLEIPGMVLKVALARESVFDSGGVVELTTRPIAVVVHALPSSQGFNGAVGVFNARTTLDRNSIALGEAATLRYVIQGVGNHKWIDKGPELSIVGARIYPPQAKSDLKVGPDGMSGSKTWEYVVVPETAGTLSIPKLGFTFFDPGQRRLETAESVPLQLTVVGGVGSNLAAVPPGSAAAVSRPVGALPLRNDLDPVTRPSATLTPRVLLFALLAALTVHGLILASGRLGERLRKGGSSTPRARQRVALRDMQRAARESLSKEAAATLIEKSLLEVFGSLDGDDDERAQAARAVLEEVRFLRYAPQLGDYSEKIREVARRAGEVIRRWA
jgi:hypothetical protein